MKIRHPITRALLVFPTRVSAIQYCNRHGLDFNQARDLYKV